MNNFTLAQKQYLQTLLQSGHQVQYIQYPSTGTPIQCIFQGVGTFKDVYGNVWSLASDGHAVKNGVNQTTGALSPYVILVLYNNNLVFGMNSTEWRKNTASPWVVTTDPRPVQDQNMAAAGFTEYYRETNPLLTEVIYTK